MTEPRLLLVGGGHAHVLVLESLARDRWPAVRPVLLSPDPEPFYTGMVPGYVQGRYEAEDLTIDLKALCAAAGAELVEDAATAIDAAGRTVATTHGSLEFDMVSLDIGSVPRGLDLPGVHEHAIALRPLTRAVALRQRVTGLARGARVAVVGGGAGGVELAFAIDRVAREAGSGASVVIVDRGEEPVEGLHPRARRRVMELLGRRGIDYLGGRQVERVEKDRVRVSGGESIVAELVVWATGPAAPGLLRESGLPCTADGFLRVDAGLRAVDGSPVWGAGDCVTIDGLEVPKAGVFAVREGPVLARNLRAFLNGLPDLPYRPQKTYLSLLNTADGKALLVRGDRVVHSRAAWWLKDWIDRRWVG